MYKEFYDRSHSLWSFLKSLSTEDIENVESLITLITKSDDPNETGQYYYGLLQGMKMGQNEICPTCDVAHDIDDHKPFDDKMEEKLGYAASLAAAGGDVSKAMFDLKSGDSDEDNGPGVYL